MSKQPSKFRKWGIRILAAAILLAASATHWPSGEDDYIPVIRSARRSPTVQQFAGKDEEKIAAEIRQLWAKLESMMTDGEKALFNPPASEEEIQSLENIIGTRLPVDFRTYLKIHNGSKTYRSCLYQRPLSIEAMKKELRSMHGYLEFGLPTNAVSKDNYNANLWRPGLMLFSEDDGAGSAIDCSTGEVINWDHDGWGFYKETKTFTEYLQNAVKNSRPGDLNW